MFIVSYNNTRTTPSGQASKNLFKLNNKHIKETTVKVTLVLLLLFYAGI